MYSNPTTAGSARSLELKVCFRASRFRLNDKRLEEG